VSEEKKEERRESERPGKTRCEGGRIVSILGRGGASSELRDAANERGTQLRQKMGREKMRLPLPTEEGGRTESAGRSVRGERFRVALLPLGGKREMQGGGVFSEVTERLA